MSFITNIDPVDAEESALYIHAAFVAVSGCERKRLHAAINE
jgi:hypothetical protein